MIDVDHNATTPLHPRVREAMRTWLGAEDAEHNPSSAHRLGQAARGAVEGARREVAAALGAQPLELTFTSGGTEANNLALCGGARALQTAGKPCGVMTTRIEHPCVLAAVEHLAAIGYPVVWLDVDERGTLSEESLRVALVAHPEVGLLSLSSANHELGNLYAVAGLCATAKGERPDLLVHTDAVQAFGKTPVDFAAWGVDLLSVSSHKIYGPKGVGALVHRKGVKLEARSFGGGQERGFRPGTEPTLAIRGFGLAATLAASEGEARREHVESLRRATLEALTKLEGVVVEGDPDSHIGNTVCCRFEGCVAEHLVMALDLEGIAVSAGAACSAGSAQPSAVLLALGRTREEAASALRFSFGRANTLDEVAELESALTTVVTRARRVSA